MLVDACFVQTEVTGPPPLMVVADASVLSPQFITAVRKGDPNRSILAIGDADDSRSAQLARKHVTFHVRPIDEGALVLAVSLVQAEGHRLSRRSERRSVRVPTTIDGTSALLLDVSTEGLRLEVDADQGAKLSPQFVLQVPVLKVVVAVQRVWVKSSGAGPRRVQCGGSLLARDERTLRVWQRLTDPASPRVFAERPAAAKVEAESLFGRILSHTPIVGSLAQLPWRR